MASTSNNNADLEEEHARSAAPRIRSKFAYSASAISRKLHTYRSVIVRILLFSPTLLAAGYFFFVASDQYVSEASFVVRSAARPEVQGGLAFLVQLGLGQSQDDAFIVQNYLTSRSAIAELRQRIPLGKVFNRPGADFIARYPSFIYADNEEEFYRYFQHMVSVVHLDKTGISALRVSAFTPEDARDMAVMLLQLGEDLVNRINQRIQADAIRNSKTELDSAQARLVAAQTALTEFRNRELTIDPTRNAVALADLIAKLSAELGITQAQISELTNGTASSPQLISLRRKAVALEEQIANERARITSGSEDLAKRIAEYERLTLEKEFARRMVSSSEAELVRSRAEATRQSLYLERVVEPNLADYSTRPARASSVLTVFVANLLAILIGWLVLSGVREHGSAH
jgi:capsular polysaccharide transport system permease protein